MKALEESRRIPRHFTLYLPISHRSPQNLPDAAVDTEDRLPINRYLTSSTSLSLVLDQLDLAIKKAGRNRRFRQRHRSPPRQSSMLDFSSFPPQTVQSGSGPVHPSALRRRKGKQRESPTTAKFPPTIEEPISKPQAWFWTWLTQLGQICVQ